MQQLGKLPGIGEKTAARLAFHILRASPEDAAALAAAIAEVEQKIRFCSVCCDLTETDPCAHLPGRPARRRHGLRGRPAPGRRRHRADRRLPRPLSRPARRPVAPGRHRPGRSAGHRADPRALAAAAGDEPIREAILATSPSVEGEATAVYLAKLLRPLGVRATRIATGVPIGGELEYADQVTLARAIDGRREM